MEGFTLADLKKRYEKDIKKKNYRGWYEATKQNAGNVPLNNAIFNMAMGSAKSVNMAQVNADNFIGDAPATADGGIGMVSMAESADSSPEYVIWVKEGEAWKPWGGCSEGKKSFLEDPERAEQWLEDASKKNKTKYTELKILENGDNSLEEDFHNLSQILKIIFDDGDYLVTRFKGTLKDAKDHFIGNTFDFDGNTKKGIGVRLMPVSSHVAEDLTEDINKGSVIDVIRELGGVAKLTADDWIALRSARDWDQAKQDLLMYGSEICALMDYVFHFGDASELIHKYGGEMGTTVNKVLKELDKKDWEERKRTWTESFNGDECELRKRIENLKDDEVLRLENKHNTQVVEEPLTLCIKKNKKFPGKYILWNEGQKSGDKLNLVNFSSLDNAVEWAKKQDEFLDEKLLKRF